MIMFKLPLTSNVEQLPRMHARAARASPLATACGGLTMPYGSGQIGAVKQIPSKTLQSIRLAAGSRFWRVEQKLRQSMILFHHSAAWGMAVSGFGPLLVLALGFRNAALSLVPVHRVV
jgi:hypothetical protein